MTDTLLLDPSASITDTVDQDGNITANAQIVPDQDGIYKRIVWLGGEMDRVNRFLDLSINRTLMDYEGTWSKRDRNIRAYEALSEQGEAITLPMCRSNTNQQHAWLMDTYYSRHPELAVDPLGDRKFTIAVKNADTGVYEERRVTATDEAVGIRQLVNYKWTYRLPMRHVLSDWCMEALQDGNLPALTKVIHDDSYYSRKLTDRAAPTIRKGQPPLAPMPQFGGDGGGQPRGGNDMMPPDRKQLETPGGGLPVLGSVGGTQPPGSDTSSPPESDPSREMFRMMLTGQNAGQFGPSPPTAADIPRDIQIVNAIEYRRHKGETVRIVTVPGTDFIKPLSSLSIDEAPWCAQKFEEPVYETHRKLTLGQRRERGGYDFCLPDGQPITREMMDEVLTGTESPADQPSEKGKKSVRTVNKQKELSPLDVNIIYEVFFRWPILTEEEAANDSPTIEWVECTGYYHLKRKKLLCCWELNNWNGERPFVDWFMRQRPNSYSGTCTVEDIAPFQRYASQLFHLQVQNMVMRNVSVFFVRRGSAAATSLRGRKLRPGMIVEFDDPSDVDPKPLGTPIESIASEISFLKAGAQEMSLITQYDSGSADLARVTSGAFAQQQDLAKMQPKQVYDNFCDAIGRLALKYIQMLIQYAPEQELPAFDAVTDAVIDNILHLPRQMVASGDFAIYPIATPTDETKEAESQRDLQLGAAIDKCNQFMLAMWAQIAKPGVPPPFVQVGLKAISRNEKMLKALISHTRHDASEYVIPEEELMSLIQQLYQMQAQQQQMQQQQQQQQMMAQQQGVQQGGNPSANPEEAAAAAAAAAQQGGQPPAGPSPQGGVPNPGGPGPGNGGPPPGPVSPPQPPDRGLPPPPIPSPGAGAGPSPPIPGPPSQ